jgi:hypothetical protein
MYGMNDFMCATQTTPLIILEDKIHDFDPDQRGGKKVGIGQASISTGTNRTNIPDQIRFQIRLNYSIWNRHVPSRSRLNRTSPYMVKCLLPRVE